MLTFGRDRRGRVVLLCCSLAMPALFALERASLGFSGLIPWSLPVGWFVTFLLLMLHRFTGRVELHPGEIRYRPAPWASWIRIEADRLRHVVLRPSWFLTTGEFRERITLSWEGGGEVSIPASMERGHELVERMKSMVLPVIRRDRMREWTETGTMRFRFPGARWGAHVLVGLTALTGGLAGVAMWRTWGRLEFAAIPFAVALTAMVAGMFVLLRRRLAWVGAELILSLEGIRIRRVDLDREYPWGLLRHSWLGEGNRPHLETVGEVIRLSAAVEDRDLLLEFLEMGRRRILPGRN